MLDTKPNKLEALHEAAHVVVALHYGIPCKTYVRKENEFGSIGHNILMENPTDTEASVIGIAALEYEKIVDDVDDYTKAASAGIDLESILEFAKSEFPGNARKQDVYITKCMKKARKILNKHWNKIEEIAEELTDTADHIYTPDILYRR